MSQCKSIEYLTNTEIDWNPPKKDYYGWCKDILTYPSIAIKNTGLLFMLKTVPEDWAINKDLEKDKKRLDEVNKNLTRLYNLLSSEFISKAPQNIIKENCNKLLNAQNEWNTLHSKINIIEEAKTFVDYIDSLVAP